MMVTLLAILAVFAAGAVYQVFGARASARRYPPPGTMIDAGAYRLHVVCSGEGAPAVVFESGIAASSLSWSRVLPDVSVFTRACAYDRAGLGWSELARSRLTVPRFLADLDRVVAHADADGGAVLVGHSFGAFLVCAYAAACPARVAGLVLLDPPSEWHSITREQARLLRGGVQLSRDFGEGFAGADRACGMECPAHPSHFRGPSSSFHVDLVRADSRTRARARPTRLAA